MVVKLIPNWLWWEKNLSQGQEKAVLTAAGKQEVNCGLSIFCSTDPSSHTDLLPLLTLWLKNNITLFPPLLPIDKSHNSYGCWRPLSLPHKHAFLGHLLKWLVLFFLVLTVLDYKTLSYFPWITSGCSKYEHVKLSTFMLLMLKNGSNNSKSHWKYWNGIWWLNNVFDFCNCIIHSVETKEIILKRK